jgi:hypothetical protein
MRIRLVLNALVLLIATAIMGVSQLRADELYGKIRGTVRDQTGAVVPDAKVTVTNPSTGVSKTTVSSSGGAFEFINLLAPAIYDLDAEKQGFRKFRAGGVHLDINQVYVADATLEIGSSTQVVTVEASTAQINTTEMQLGTSVTGSTIVDMPLVDRNWIELQQLQPGVVGASDRFGNGSNGAAKTNYATNGAETQQNSFYVNGVDTADISLNAAGIIPSPDAIGEFHLVTSTINPEYGRNSGAVMNAVIKNGTNQLHGDGFDFYRDTFLDARNFFQATTPPFQQNIFGGTVGGPVVFPHLYNGRNKTFFFFSYQGIRNVQPEVFGVPTVYTAAQRGGAFSDLASSSGSSGSPMVGDDGTTYPAGTPYSTIFAAGQIPAADLNPLALKLMNQYVPLPNAPSNGYTFSPSTTEVDDQYITRIDQNFGTKDAIWGYWFWERQPTTEGLPFGGGADLPGFTESDKRHFQQYALSWTHTFSPTTLNEARFGYSRFNINSVNPQTPINPTSYGFTGITPQNPAAASLPVMALTGYFTLGFSEFGPQPRLENTYQVIDNFSKVAGRHTVKFGFTTDRFQVYNPFYAYLSGYFQYNGLGTFTTGDPGADFLLGLPDSYWQTNGSVIDARSREYYSYAQDEFRLRANLTLTYGVGWDIETPYLNRYYDGKLVNAFRPGQQSTVFPTAPLGVLWPGDAGINSTGGVRTPYKNLAPRVGFAWSPGGSHQWSVHSGFGMYYNRTEEELALQNLSTPPFFDFSTGVGGIGGSPSFAAPYTGWCPASGAGGAPSACSSPNPFPYSPPPAGSKNVNFAALEPLTINTLDRNFAVPMSFNYNLTIERQLGTSTTLTAAYVGNQGRHLEGDFELNPAGEAGGLNPVAAAAGCTPFNLATCAPQTFAYNPQTTGLAAINHQATDFNSRYNSLQISVNKRLTHGLAFLASYTWSRFFDQNSTPDLQDSFVPPGINPFSFASMWAPSNNDAPQRFVFSYNYTLPFYHYVPHVRQLIDGWKLAGITTFQSGFPVQLFNSADPSLTCNAAAESDDVPCWDRPNRTSTPVGIGDPRSYALGGNPNYWFNPASFAMASPGTGIGNASRNPLYGPGFNNFDLSLEKEVHITESKYIQLRLETYNTFNHTQWFPGSYQPTNNAGGVVSDINDPRFGRVIAANPARVIQLAGKIYF